MFEFRLEYHVDGCEEMLKSSIKAGDRDGDECVAKLSLSFRSETKAKAVYGVDDLQALLLSTKIARAILEAGTITGGKSVYLDEEGDPIDLPR